MAELILTEAEKKAATYDEWDDDALGKMMRQTILLIENEGSQVKAGLNMAAALVLIGRCVETNATRMALDAAEHTSHGVPTGDWRITVERVKPA